MDNPFTYFGQTYDEVTGLYYLRARYYDPTTGRFTQQDPAEDGYNWYVYGNQNPVIYADYTGEEAATIVVSGVTVFLASPAGQELLVRAQSLGLSVVNYVNLYGYQAMNIVATYGGAIIDKASNFFQYATDKAGETFNNAKQWLDKQFNGGPSLKNVNNKTANEIAKKNGFKDAHEFKEYFVGTKHISNFNMKIDKNTGQIFLESVKKGGSLIATGYYK